MNVINQSEMDYIIANLQSVMWIIIIMGVIMIISLWKIFTKAGVKGWKSLIPIYSEYTLLKIIGVNPMWLVIIFITGIFAKVPVIGQIAITIVPIYYGALVAISLARAFGKTDMFGFGIYIVKIIFYPIIAFSKDIKYLGNKNAMKDIVFKKQL